MEGPYRDLGEGFARLTGLEGARRGPSRVQTVEDALRELLRNARDAGARSIYVASTLKRRRYRSLTVLDDGEGIPEPYTDLIFEPGVTTRHLSPVHDHADTAPGAPHGAGLALYHIRNAALEARVLSASSPTAVSATFDTDHLPERALQSGSRPSRTNLLATVEAFARANETLSLYHGPPARILATLLKHRIIQSMEENGPTSSGSSAEIRERAAELGLGVSVRTVQRILRGEIPPLGRVEALDAGRAPGASVRPGSAGVATERPVLRLGEKERAEIAAILERAARAGYLELAELVVEARPGEVLLRARVYEPEEEYE
jgi:hypothetical protein